MTDALAAKEHALRELILESGTLAIAYSGGVDSSYLADVAHETIGNRATLILADSPSIPRSEVKEAIVLAEERGWNLTIIHTEEFEQEDYLIND